MKISISTQDPARLKADLTVVVLDPETTLAEPGDGEFRTIVDSARRDFKVERLKRELFHTFGTHGPLRNLLVFSTTLSKAFNVWENVKIFASRSLAYARDYGYDEIAFMLNHAEGAAFVGKAVEGFILAGYRFDKYKKEKSKGSDPAVTIVVRPQDKAASEARLKRYRIVSEEINRCRDLVNEPGGAMYPGTLAAHAKAVASESGLDVTILDEKQLEKQGYQGLLAVGRGSAHPPRLIVMRYRPGKKSKHHVALVGKGITFDTGGISIKPAEGMYTMKGDMAGGAAVIHSLVALAKLKPALQVTGIVPAAENFPGQHAQRPGDIFIAKNGKSIMVDNTDAEGRLVLTDGLARAGEEKATHIVDIATLTGSCVRALGTGAAGIMGTDRKLIASLIRAGINHGEPIWELPLIEEYREMLKTPYADINNVGGKVAGAITAALFLREFVPPGLSWAHLDIAGPFLVEKAWKYYKEGATGFGLKTMVDLCEHFDQYQKEA